MEVHVACLYIYQQLGQGNGGPGIDSLTVVTIMSRHVHLACMQAGVGLPLCTDLIADPGVVLHHGMVLVSGLLGFQVYLLDVCLGIIHDPEVGPQKLLNECQLFLGLLRIADAGYSLFSKHICADMLGWSGTLLQLQACKRLREPMRAVAPQDHAPVLGRRFDATHHQNEWFRPRGAHCKCIRV